jgi:hypothetical protein
MRFEYIMFQVILNMKLQSTGGQATKSVLLSLVGKMTDFLSTYLLVLPLQYVVMAYFSSSMCYINGLQLVWYWGQQGKLVEHSTDPPGQPGESGRPSDADDDDDGDDREMSEDTRRMEQEQASQEEPLLGEGPTDTRQERTFAAAIAVSLRIGALAILCLVLLGYLAGLAWNTWSPLVVLAPVAIIVVLVVAYFYHNRSRYCLGRS